MRTQTPDHMAQQRGSAPCAPNPRCLAPNSVARTLNLLPRPKPGGAFDIPRTTLKEGEEVGDASRNEGQGVTGRQGPRCRTHLCPRVLSSLLFQREHRARFKGGASRKPPQGVPDHQAPRRGSARRAPHPHRPPSMARSMRTRKSDHMARRRGSAPRAPNPRCLAPNSVARILNLLPRPNQGACLISPGQR